MRSSRIFCIVGLCAAWRNGRVKYWRKAGAIVEQVRHWVRGNADNNKGHVTYQRVFALQPVTLDPAVQAHVHGARLSRFGPSVGVVVNLAVEPALGDGGDGADGRVAGTGRAAISADNVPGVTAVHSAGYVRARGTTPGPGCRGLACDRNWPSAFG